MKNLLVFALLLASLVGISSANATDFKTFIPAQTTATAPYGATDYFPLVVGAGTSTQKVPGNTIATLIGTQTLTNKTLTSPIFSTISNTGTLTLPTSTDTLVGRATTDTLTNKTLTSPIFSTISNTGTLTLPTSTDTLVGRATTDTLTNKTLTSPAINTGVLVGGTINNMVIGGATPVAGSFTTVSATGNLTTNVTGSTQCLHANSSGVVSGTGSDCGSGGGSSWTITDGTNSVSSVTTLTVNPNNFLVAGSAGSATLAFVSPNSTKTGNYTFAAADMGGGVNLNGTFTLTIPAISSTVFANKMIACYQNIGSGTVTISTTPTINGMTGTSVFPGNGGCFVSNGTSLDWQAGSQPASSTIYGSVLQGTTGATVGLLNANKTDSGNNTLSGVNTYTGTVIGSNTNFSGTGSISLGAACGKTVHYTGGSAGTLTINSAEIANCNFPVVATSTGLATIAASGGSFIANTACAANKRTKETGSVLWVHVISNAGSAPVVSLSGDCG